MKKLAFVFLALLYILTANAQDPVKILDEVDKNLSADSRILDSKMIVYGKRNDRTMTAHSITMGDKKAFTEYLSPARDKGTKMLKLDKELWMYSPSTDRTIMISGHMLRQSLMGSDLSYEDMMEDRKLNELYKAVISGEETLDNRTCYVMLLTAKVPDVAYYSMKMWVDKERLIPLRQELSGKSGQLLKHITLSDIKRIDNRWFPMKMNYKDVLKDGKGTDWIILSIQFDQPIPKHVFSKASLKQ